jgi:hypothetical protein
MILIFAAANEVPALAVPPVFTKLLLRSRCFTGRGPLSGGIKYSKNQNNFDDRGIFDLSKVFERRLFNDCRNY